MENYLSTLDKIRDSRSSLLDQETKDLENRLESIKYTIDLDVRSSEFN
jgi:hypothetical protein